MFIAESTKGEMLGLIAGILLPSLSKLEALEELPTKRGKILELYVDESRQRQGIGGHLMETMEDYFKKEGCDFFLVDCFGPNKKAYDFYKKHHYEERMILLIKPSQVL